MTKAACFSASFIARARVWGGKLIAADLQVVRIASQTARSSGGQRCAIAISKLGNGWLYPFLAALILADWGLSGCRIIVLSSANAALMHCLYPIVKQRFQPFTPVLGRSKTAVLARDARRAFLSKRSCHDTDQRACSDCYSVASDGNIVGSVGLLSGLGAGRNSSSLPQRCVRGRYSGRWRRLSDFIVPDFTVVTLVARRLGCSYRKAGIEWRVRHDSAPVTI